MYLHEEKELFKEILERTAEANSLPEDIIEKDYYVYLLLREINTLCPNAVFKGGTSLSKCFHVINRFSEDIDLTFDMVIKKDKRSKKIKHNTIMKASENLSFPILNLDKTEGDWDVCHYDFEPPVIANYSVSKMNPNVTIETSFLSPCGKPIIRSIDSYIFKFLYNQFPEQLEKFDLSPFDMKVQPIDITFVDKVYAICDYYLEGTIEKHSRHLYDIYKMSPFINFDDEFRNLVKAIRAHRETLDKTFSVHQEKSIIELTDEIKKSEIYKTDFNERTRKLNTEREITYEMVIENYCKVVSCGYF